MITLNCTFYEQNCDRKRQRIRTRSASKETISEHDIPTTSDDVSFQVFVRRNQREIQDIVQREQSSHRYGCYFIIKPACNKIIVYHISRYITGAYARV